MLVIGLTGGIASGKTAVSDLFADLGVPIIDADQVSRELVEPGSPILDQIANRFGQEYIQASGELDRALLRKHIFSDQEARLELESILHPAIREEMENRLSGLDSAYALLVIPLLTENELGEMVDRVLLVDVPESVQIQRVTRRDNISVREAEEILRSQATRAQRLAIADEVIDNGNSLSDLDRNVRELHQKYLQLSNSSAS